MYGYNQYFASHEMSNDASADDVFEGISSGEQTDTKQVYRFELTRLQSFALWPADAKAFPTLLARVGLFYLGSTDTVACFVCNVHLGQWEEEDLPLGEHERHSPNCGFVLGQDVGNVPLLTGNQVFTIEVIREQEDEIRNQRAIAQSTGLGKSCNDGTVNDVTELIQNLSRKYPFSVLTFDQSRFSLSGRGKAPDALGSCQDDSMLERYAGRGNTASDISSLQAESVSQKLRELRLTGSNTSSISQRPSSDGTNISPPQISERQQQIQQAIISVATEPVRQGITEYCPVDVLQSIMQSSNHPQYAHINRRIESFATWPYSHVQSPIKLAEAGFYYTGREDRIRCFLCNGGLCNWESEDIPWYEHCKWFERCRYALACKRNPVVAAIVNTATQLRSADTHSSLQGETQCDDEQRSASPSASETSVVNTTAPTNQTSLRSQLLDMGYAEDRINRMQELLGTELTVDEATQFLANEDSSPPSVARVENGSNQETEADVVNTLPTDGAASADPEQDSEAKSKDETNKKKKKKNKKRNGKSVASSAREEDGACATESTHDAGAGSETNTVEDITTLLEENETLKSRRTCKVCMERDVSIIFLPCSHLVCCLECAMQVTTCPFCRGPIKATVKVYL